MEKEKYGIGTKHTTNEGCLVEIVEKLEYPMRKVRFENGYEVDTSYSNIRYGKIKNPYHPSVCGVGYLGVGEYNTKIDGKRTPEYAVWQSMFHRCYDEKYQERQPTYRGVVVCQEWHNFQTFSKWYEENFPEIEGIKFQLDKDLLQENIKNKLYSPETCIFLPEKINTFLTNRQSDNTSGFVGVCWHKIGKKWHAQISLFGKRKQKHLGLFVNPEEASLAYQQARKVEAEKVKSYLRGLNYLPEEIIQLIK